MNLKLILIFGLIVMLTAKSQETASSENLISNSEISTLIESTKLTQWVEIVKKSSFNRESRRPVFFDNWKAIYSDRPFDKAWSSEKAVAEVLLQRACKDNQRKWLTRFVEACDALATKDAKTFAALVPALVEDYKTLF